MLVSTCRYKPLLTRVTPVVLAHVLTDTTNLGQLELRLAVVALEATLCELALTGDVVEGLDLRATDR